MDSKLKHIVDVGGSVPTNGRMYGGLRTALLAALLAAPALVACSQSAPTAAPKPKAPAADTQPATVTPQSTSPAATTDNTTATLSVELADASNTLKFEVGKPIEVAFTLKGADNTQAIVGLSELPTGSKLTRSGTSLTLSWDAPTNGDQSVRFLIRNRAACVAAEGDATSCALNVADFGSLTKKSYDTESQTFTLHVGTGTGAGTGTTTGAGAGGGALIQQILGLLGKGGAGGTGGGADIQSLLGSLSSGQLTQLLGSLKNGGAGAGAGGAGGAGGFDISSILALLHGSGLRDDVQPGADLGAGG